MVRVRHVGIVQRRLREDAASASAEVGKTYPARCSAVEPQNRWPPISPSFSCFQLISANFTSRPQGGCVAPNSISPQPATLSSHRIRVFRVFRGSQTRHSPSFPSFPSVLFSHVPVLRESVPSVPSAVQFLCFRLCRRASLALSRVPLRPSKAIQSKCLSMNDLHAKPGHLQSSSIKPNQA